MFLRYLNKEFPQKKLILGIGVSATTPTEEQLYDVSELLDRMMIFCLRPHRRGGSCGHFPFGSQDQPSYRHGFIFLPTSLIICNAQKMAPDLRRKVDATRAARLAREAEIKRQESAQVSHGNIYLRLHTASLPSC